MPVATLDTPVGRLAVSARDDAIVALDWSGEDEGARTPLLVEALGQLKAYFSGTLKAFDLPLAPRGAAFHQQVFAAMSAIPYGQTRTYGEIAAALGTCGQPVGQACGANPIPVIIPCHRVLSAQGLGGYSGAGGLETKIALLKLEGGYPFLV
ncbi:methylated-DNA--[protein]-cysteine S-methyltransferase [Breoghania sp. L-A4]|uniref:methylated-DNA--[protein]-cysteine S-methyltransferase n=1 Tax=Breoghania sp. L-A4 TaxID=2304600 RepID=UPI000E35FBB3|nr:methylated-DNA--[protein]-cysteine S-methyltransferase [Breoghania sp. L-A4]AXS39142.1 methylated-DNA--[protein]-cysteine S-methyltransferase [Breoghania sp. L-A4]